jgi:hypothetical protein
LDDREGRCGSRIQAPQAALTHKTIDSRKSSREEPKAAQGEVRRSGREPWEFLPAKKPRPAGCGSNPGHVNAISVDSAVIKTFSLCLLRTLDE